MPLGQSFPSPYNSETLDSWSYFPIFSVNLADGVIRVSYLRYADRASSYAGKPPVERVELVVSGQECADLIAANQDLFDLIKTRVDAFALTQPQFAGGIEVD